MAVSVDGARPVKGGRPADLYVQYVAEPGRDSVTVAGEEIKLKEGYTEIPVKDWEGEYFLEILMSSGSDSPNRPLFHFTPPAGYMNDPNGLVRDGVTGEYHLFYQSFPYSPEGGKKHWGHAVTRDLVTFEDRPVALYPDRDGFAVWSGTGFADRKNDAGLYPESTPPDSRLVLAYYLCREDAVRAGLAFTPDGGETWVRGRGGATLSFCGAYPGHIDPKVLWVEKFGKWVMFTASGEIFTSSDLWTWTFAGKDDPGECPDIYEMSVLETGEKKYVRSYSGTYYRVGDLTEDGNGVRFAAETGELPMNGDSLDVRARREELRRLGWFSGKTGSCYATQHFSDAPEGRTVSVSWLIERGLDPARAGALTVPTEQTLHRGDGGYCLSFSPVKELDALRGKTLYSRERFSVSPGEDILGGVGATAADIDGVFVPDGDVEEFGFRLRVGEGGYIAVKYVPRDGELVADYSHSGDERYDGIRRIAARRENAAVALRVLLDTVIVECFAGGAPISSVFSRPEKCRGIELYTVGGKVEVERLRIYEMGSVFKK